MINLRYPEKRTDCFQKSHVHRGNYTMPTNSHTSNSVFQSSESVGSSAVWILLFTVAQDVVQIYRSVFFFFFVSVYL